MYDVMTECCEQVVLLNKGLADWEWGRDVANQRGPPTFYSYVPTLLMWCTIDLVFLCSYTCMQREREAAKAKVCDIWNHSIQMLTYKIIHLKALTANVTVQSMYTVPHHRPFISMIYWKHCFLIHNINFRCWEQIAHWPSGCTHPGKTMYITSRSTSVCNIMMWIFPWALVCTCSRDCYNPLGFYHTLICISIYFLSLFLTLPALCCCEPTAPMGRCWDDKKQTVWKAGRGRKGAE